MCVSGVTVPLFHSKGRGVGHGVNGGGAWCERVVGMSIVTPQVCACVCVCVSGVTESLFYSGGGGGGLGPDLRLGGLEDGIAMIFPITFIVHNQKSNGGGGHGVNGGWACP